MSSFSKLVKECEKVKIKRDEFIKNFEFVKVGHITKDEIFFFQEKLVLKGEAVKALEPHYSAIADGKNFIENKSILALNTSFINVSNQMLHYLIDMLEIYEKDYKMLVSNLVSDSSYLSPFKNDSAQFIKFYGQRLFSTRIYFEHQKERILKAYYKRDEGKNYSDAKILEEIFVRSLSSKDESEI